MSKLLKFILPVNVILLVVSVILVTITANWLVTLPLSVVIVVYLMITNVGISKNKVDYLFKYVDVQVGVSVVMGTILLISVIVAQLFNININGLVIGFVLNMLLAGIQISATIEN